MRTPGIQSEVAATTAVAASTATVTLLPASHRLGVAIFNDSTADLYVKFGAGASASDFGVKVGAGGYYETPANYVGVLTGAWASANGSARLTEFL